MYKVMVVDDDKLARLGLINSVEWLRFDMAVVCDTAHGTEAIDYAKANVVDLAFIDLEMPGMFGIDLLKRLKAESPNTRCAVLTMHNEFTYIQEALRIGVLDYIIKTELGGDSFEQVIGRLQNRLEEQHKLEDGSFENNESVSHEIKKCITKAIALVEVERGVYLTATEVAGRVNMSRSYFSTCFKQLVGQSFNEYFKQVRLEYAKEALSMTSNSISIIAEESGFSDESYFATVFKNYTGKSPTEYRRKKARKTGL